MNQGKRNIAHMDLDTFYVSVERLGDSRLEGKPILLGGTGDRGVVASCSYEARQFGIRSGMSMKIARQLCPEGIVIKGDAWLYSKYSKMVTEIIREYAPLVEKSSIDEFYLDLTGMDRFFGCYKWAGELRKKIINETGLPISFGMSSNKTVSKIATGEAKPNNQMEVEHGQEKLFLAPLPIQKIPMIGKQSAFLLNQMGVQWIKTLQQMPAEVLEKALGKNGTNIWQKANGIDHSPLVPYHEKKSIGTERTFLQDTIDIKKINTLLMAMAEQLAFELRQSQKVCSSLSIKIKYSDFQTVSKQKKIAYTSSDHVLIPTALDLFKQLYQRRIRIRLIGVKVSDIITGGVQLDLFQDNEKLHNLYHAMDQIKIKYGVDKLKRGANIDTKGLGRGNPFSGEPNVIPGHRNM
jgi:DNA polymerase-4